MCIRARGAGGGRGRCQEHERPSLLHRLRCAAGRGDEHEFLHVLRQHGNGRHRHGGHLLPRGMGQFLQPVHNEDIDASHLALPSVLRICEGRFLLFARSPRVAPVSPACRALPSPTRRLPTRFLPPVSNPRATPPKSAPPRVLPPFSRPRPPRIPTPPWPFDPVIVSLTGILFRSVPMT